MAQEDECGEFDATMDFPIYELKAKMAELYLLGGFGLDKDASYAGINCWKLFQKQVFLFWNYLYFLFNVMCLTLCSFDQMR